MRITIDLSAFLLAMAGMIVGVVYMCAPSPNPSHPPTREKKTLIQSKYCQRAKGRTCEHQMKEYRVAAAAQSHNKETFSFSHHPEQGAEHVLVFENSFRKTKIIVETGLTVRQRRNRNTRRSVGPHGL